MKLIVVALLLLAPCGLSGCIAAAVGVGAAGGYIAADNMTRPTGETTVTEKTNSGDDQTTTTATERTNP